MARRSRPYNGNAGTLRREIAAAAGRLMAEDGIADYGYAKRKAARNLGLGESEAGLPTNEEIEAELRAYQALYQSEELPARLAELRRDALEAMDLLAEFHPYLTGAVLDGTAGRYAGIELEIFADSAKDVEIALLSRGISYHPDEKFRHRPGAPEAQLVLEWAGAPLRISVYPRDAERAKSRSPRGGEAPTRADRSAVAALLK